MKAAEHEYSEEMATEVAAPRVDIVGRNGADSIDSREVRNNENVDESSGRGMGMFGLVLSVLSLFFLPVILGAAGIIVGFVARRRGAVSLGAWAIGVGAASIVVSLFVAPFF
ncbi:hypothetical protein BFG57_11880 [Bacillus solimangrovi]|uniref:DUF4190 domain-containing protein n=2 Tax=Bacillus solimangrovi TaxID=1305675 RepID=A0A1E5LI22_9BACI|nr:hypothetical protein BFG57_11880 [Bacillus solimangrovi]